MSVLLALTAALLFAIGTYLVLQHTLTRILIGIALITHGANVPCWAAAGGGRPR
jgi:multicomponent Na+:H+ antiporter subunit C